MPISDTSEDRRKRRRLAKKTAFKKSAGPSTGARDERKRDRSGNKAAQLTNILIAGDRQRKGDSRQQVKRQALAAVNATLSANEKIKKRLK